MTEHQEAIEVVVGVLCGGCEGDCDMQQGQLCPEVTANAEQILSLKWPDGSPMIYVGAKASPDLYASVTEAMNTGWTDEDRYMSLIRQGFRKVVIDESREMETS